MFLSAIRLVSFQEQLTKIAEMPDLNADIIEAAKKIVVLASFRSMGDAYPRQPLVADGCFVEHPTLVMAWVSRRGRVTMDGCRRSSPTTGGAIA